MARSWGDGSPTQSLHRVSFDLYERLATELQCTSYRKLPVLSVAPSSSSSSQGESQHRNSNPQLSTLIPSWLDGSTGRISAMGYGDDTAQITPREFVQAMLRHAADRIQVVQGTCVGVESTEVDDEDQNTSGTDVGNTRRSNRVQRVTGVRYQTPTTRSDDENTSSAILPADCVVVSAGPWSCGAEDWFPAADSLQLPMEGVKSTSIVWKKPASASSLPDATALFCGENNRFGTHCKCLGHVRSRVDCPVATQTGVMEVAPFVVLVETLCEACLTVILNGGAFNYRIAYLSYSGSISTSGWNHIHLWYRRERLYW